MGDHKMVPADRDTCGAVRVVMVGPPGAGKGTQAALLAKAHGIPHISTGEMLREAEAAGTALGLQVKETLAKGELVSDNVMIEIIRERLQRADCVRGFLLDGFPRTIEQAKALDSLLSSLHAPLTHVVEITVPQEILVERIMSRAAAGSGRSDDNRSVAERRLQVFWTQTAPVIEYYRVQPRGVQKIDGVGTIEAVSERVSKIVASPRSVA